jgi:hypothetical protein
MGKLGFKTSVFVGLMSVLFCASATTLSIRREGGGTVLEWEGGSNVSYRVVQSTNLAEGVWTTNTPAIPGTGSTILQPVSCDAKAACFSLVPQYPDVAAPVPSDMLTPGFYNAGTNDPLRAEVNRFVYYARKTVFQHPFENGAGQIPSYTVPAYGIYGAGKPARKNPPDQYHPAVDMYFGGATNVDVFAAHDGVVSTYRDALKYRHYLAIAKEVFDGDGNLLGKVVTLYAHLDLDLDEADGLFLDGETVAKGDRVSGHLYSGTAGGPHMHFEIRYYRPGETGNEEFYGLGTNPGFTEPSSGPWSYGYWAAETGYGYGYPPNHGLSLE